MDPLGDGDPRQLGTFKIIARLGSGGMGVVFLGAKGSQRVAVKVVRSSFLDSPALKTRFQREIETLKRLKSPYVARYLDSDIEGELAWHAVEFVNGPTLKERVEHDGTLSTNEWWAFYNQIRNALHDIHGAGVIHRDLKPSNIILGESGMKLIDFGISQDSDATSITTTGTVAGSPAWLSPEQLAGTEIGPGSDMFSAGSILVYAALGRSPWGSEATMTVPVAYQRILTRDFNLDNLSDPMREAVTSLLAEDERNRAFVGTSSVPRPAPTEISIVPQTEIGDRATRKEPEAPNLSKPQSPPASRKFRTALWLVAALFTTASVAFVAVLASMESEAPPVTAVCSAVTAGTAGTAVTAISVCQEGNQTRIEAQPPSPTHYLFLYADGADDYCEENMLVRLGATNTFALNCDLMPDGFEFTLVGPRGAGETDTFEVVFDGY